MNSALKWGLILGGVAFLFRTEIETALGIATSSSTNTTSTTTPSTATTTTPPATGGGYTTLAGIYARMLAIMQQNNVAQSQGSFVGTPWGFNYWLNQVSGFDLSSVIGTVFPGCGTAGPCDTSNITFPAFWTAVAPYLQSTKGLSGAPTKPRTRAAAAWGY